MLSVVTAMTQSSAETDKTNLLEALETITSSVKQPTTVSHNSTQADDDYIDGGLGNDLIEGFEGAMTIFWVGFGNDRIFGFLEASLKTTQR